ncbi:MAG TPA: flagellar biosynthesis protein FlhA [Candidatus Methylomirabilis sp.]|nr:flagellar biosynthesis protein FlhA [Candidatus Methylomirabilis sp.]
MARPLLARTDAALAMAVLGILAVMLVPLPPLLLDLLLTTNIALSLLTLLIGMYILRPLDFSVFPSVLLLLTLFRLSLNVASTRLILLQGNEGPSAAGEVIHAFGRFVVGGSYVVGGVVFLILVVIQFVVITKGAGRIAEVAARFTLDAMPGKQLAIDADLNAGLITEGEARGRRREIGREADFYGAMDGASKFVRGDAIAGILITAVNIVGGLIIGILQLRMDVGEALTTYTLLTVGDGLVTQIPALVVSTAAGIVVTRTASEAELGVAVAAQFAGHHRALAITAAVLLVLGLVPGLPKMPFLLMAAVTGTVAYGGLRQKRGAAEAEPTPPAAGTGGGPEKVEKLLALDPLELEVGYSLIPLVDAAQGGDLLDRVRLVRRQFATDLGFVVPPVRVRDNLQLKPSAYAIKIRGLQVAAGEILMGHFLAMNPGTATESVGGLPTTEPTFGLPAQWISSEERERAQVLGYTVVDPSSVMATHLTETIRRHARDLLGRQEVQALIDHLKPTHPSVVEALVPQLLPLGTVQKVLQGLLGEGVSIRDLALILEVMTDAAPATKDPILLTEYVRQALGRAICRTLTTADGLLKVFTLSPALEQRLIDALADGDQGRYLALPPRMAQRVIEHLAATLGKGASDSAPVVLCAPALRPHLRRLTERYLPHLAVLSYNEIGPDVTLKALAMVECPDAPTTV